MNIIRFTTEIIILLIIWLIIRTFLKGWIAFIISLIAYFAVKIGVRFMYPDLK
jgi:hypothetical protein